MEQQPKQEVVVTDIHMQFGSMVVFMIKWAIAAIPAVIILVVLAGVFWSFLFAGLLSVGSVGSRVGTAPGESNATSTATKPDKADAVTAAYLPKLSVRSVRVDQNVLGQTGVFGEVRNDGDRTLKRVEIVIYCLGPGGKPVYETSYPAVSVSSLGDNEPLKPGYSRKFGVKMDEAPSDWTKKVEVKVKNIDFQ